MMDCLFFYWRFVQCLWFGTILLLLHLTCSKLDTLILSTVETAGEKTSVGATGTATVTVLHVGRLRSPQPVVNTRPIIGRL